MVTLAVAVLAVPVLTAPVAAAEDVTFQCTTTFGTSNVVECSSTGPLGQGSFRCESPGLVTSLAGVITVAPARCTATGSSLLVTGDGELTASTVVIDRAARTVSILNGTAGFTLTQPQTGSSLSVACDGSVLVLTAVPLALHTPSGTCEGDMTMNVPGVGTAHASMVCTGSAVSLTATPFALLIPAGSCAGELTVTVPGVGNVRISAVTAAIAFTIDPVPVLTITGPEFTVEVTPAGGTTHTVSCSAVTIDLSVVPVLTVPHNLCTTT